MNEFRREIKHGPGSLYAWVDLGAIEGYPGWHMQAALNSYPFPTDAAAHLFAMRNKEAFPSRKVTVRLIDGRSYDMVEPSGD